MLVAGVEGRNHKNCWVNAIIEYRLAVVVVFFVESGYLLNGECGHRVGLCLADEMHSIRCSAYCSKYTRYLSLRCDILRTTQTSGGCSTSGIGQIVSLQEGGGASSCGNGAALADCRGQIRAHALLQTLRKTVEDIVWMRVRGEFASIGIRCVLGRLLQITNPL